MKDREELTTGDNSGTYSWEKRKDDVFQQAVLMSKIAIDSISPEDDRSQSSLYNLLDHSFEDLDILHNIVNSFTRDSIEPIKESVPTHYSAAKAWLKILETAKSEREIKETLNQK